MIYFSLFYYSLGSSLIDIVDVFAYILSLLISLKLSVFDFDFLLIDYKFSFKIYFIDLMTDRY